jgi:predicted pyridoxine 5'-phosphate oxidase superfamily flavin-nucleotide-binding protein
MHYHEQSRLLQDRFDTRRLADRLMDVKVHRRFTPDDRAFVESLDMFFLATVGPDGQPDCSYKGGDPGFVRVLDDETLAFPSWDGNGMFLSLGNVLAMRRVGLLFIDFARQRRMRVNGTATAATDDPLLAEWPEAQLVVRVRAEAIFPNCGRYIHQLSLVERSRFVPHADAPTPTPDWKRAPWAADVLAQGDPARES